jgi:epsilon-lactone hydrolase
MASWQAHLTAAGIRLFFKRETSGEEAEMVRFWRSRLKPPPKFLRPSLPEGARVEPVTTASMKGEWIKPGGQPDSVIVYLHGGGYVAGSPLTHRGFTMALARNTGANVFALDYRLAPEHRFPAAVEDTVACYEWLLSQGVRPEQIVIGGDSAGGGLTIAALLALRDQGRKLPAAAFCLSPWTDLNGHGSTIRANDLRDAMFYGRNVAELGKVYAGATPLDSPLVSPIHADLRGLPPLRIYASECEILLDDSIRLAERARSQGVTVDLQVWKDMVHVWPVFIGYGLPEAQAVVAELADFIQKNTTTAPEKLAEAKTPPGFGQDAALGAPAS